MLNSGQRKTKRLTENKGERCFIVSEMLDLRNRRLADVAKVDDFIVSDHLICLMLTQFSENSALYQVFPNCLTLWAQSCISNL
jgi:hypothetical protein